MEVNYISHSNHDESDTEVEIDPIYDIIDYLVRCAKISFKNAHINEGEVKTSDKIEMAYELFKKSPTEFLMQFGKYLAPNHLIYFDKLKSTIHEHNYAECMRQLKVYHSEESKRKRIRNRRYKALQKLESETDYFSDKQMMSRNPLLYEQLVGQYLTDEEIRERDGVDRENLTFLNLILETVDRNQMRETKNEQLLAEKMDITKATEAECKSSVNEDNVRSNKQWGEFSEDTPKKQWGDFDKIDTRPDHKPEVRKQCTISAPERRLFREEFLQEMYSSFIEGRDDVDYEGIDNDEQYDDLKQFSQDEEDKYFDSESNEVENLEQHMILVDEYTKKQTDYSTEEDPLDVFMTHLSNRLNMKHYCFVLILTNNFLTV
ncbi:unnamed protein product [Diatraea saccharalis]|uniref:CCD97-like C-terminal domain-containing protein n=1 Tax=Diatraea saccharalis TaxID=40085 RepID=A0A9N9QY33_9NEOP|nr:unnamed protein product [Diatraea saccharalis]